MLGARSPAEIQRYRSALGITEPLCALAAVAFLPPQGALDPESEVRASYEALRGAVRYKTRALAGPLVSGLCAVLLPVREGEEGAMAGLLAAIEAALSVELSRGRIRLGLGEQLPLAEAGSSWSGALARLLAPEAEGDDAGPAQGSAAGSDAQGASSAGLGFEEDEAFLEALLSSPERASLELERILGSLRGPSEPSLAGRYRLIVLLGSALRSLGLRGLLSPAEAGGAMNFDDLRLASGSGGLELAVRARLAALLAAAARVERRSSPVRAAVERIKESFDKPITLDFVADELALAPSRLSRLFIEETGKGFSDFLIEYRIERAKEMLAQPGATIKRVSAACGYPDPNYFSRLFKKVTGLTPSTLIPKAEGDER
jgi:AraC-like DNA-binding protein